MTLYAESKPRETEYQFRGLLARLARAELQRQQQLKQRFNRKGKK